MLPHNYSAIKMYMQKRDEEVRFLEELNSPNLYIDLKISTSLVQRFYTGEMANMEIRGTVLMNSAIQELKKIVEAGIIQIDAELAKL